MERRRIIPSQNFLCLDLHARQVMPFKGTNGKMFNPIASNILKRLRFKFVWWIHYWNYLALFNNGFGLFSTVEFP
jgi:hypothetical protein